MALATRTTLKGYFETGDKPTQSNFADLIDSSAEKEYQYITATGNQDYSSTITTSCNILVNVALANTNYIRLPEATTSNGGMHIRVVFGIAIADVAHVGFKTSVIQGGAVAVGDTNEAQGSSLDYATAIADAADVFHRVSFDLDTAAGAGGTGGTVLDFFYPGVANVVLYRGHLISEIDDPTLASHFSTTEVDA